MCLAILPVLPAAPELPNLCARLVEWLGLLGFSGLAHDYSVGNCQYATGTWRDPAEGQRYRLEYCWAPGQPAHGTCALWVETGTGTAMLVAPQHVGKLKHAQYLLLRCARFRQAYLQAHPGVDLPI